jgi:hypothetical protein
MWWHTVTQGRGSEGETGEWVWVASTFHTTSERGVSSITRVQLKCDGTRWRKGVELKGKLANGVGSQCSSHYLGTGCIPAVLESSWNVMAHGDARDGKWRGNWRMEWVASTLHTTSEYGVLLPLMRTPRLPVVEWTDALADLNGIVRFGERRNLVSARVPSHFKRSLPTERFKRENG